MSVVVLLPPNPLFSRNQRTTNQQPRYLFLLDSSSSSSSTGLFLFNGRRRGNLRRRRAGSDVVSVRAQSFWPGSSAKPGAIEMESIKDTDHLDRILEQARQLSQPVIIDWMANWCRKCIYLKPKLEKLAAEFDTKLKFYYVDVNKVPQDLVKRGNISKMPTIQLWKDGEMKAEVIGGHKGWLVIEEVREMIQNFV